MEKYIGLDVHAASTTFAVIGESGKRLSSHVVETNGQALVEQLKAIAGKKHVCLEEGTQSAWLYEILSPHAESIVVAMVSESRGQKNDERDAFALAELLRTGGLKRTVFKETGKYRQLGELGRAHTMVVQDVVGERPSDDLLQNWWSEVKDWTARTPVVGTIDSSSDWLQRSGLP